MGSRSEISWHRFQLILLLLALKCCAGVSGSNPDLNEIVPPVSKTDPPDDTESLSKDSAIAKPTDPSTPVISPDGNGSVSSSDVDTPDKNDISYNANIPAINNTLSSVDTQENNDTLSSVDTQEKNNTLSSVDSQEKNETLSSVDTSEKNDTLPGDAIDHHAIEGGEQEGSQPEDTQPDDTQPKDTEPNDTEPPESIIDEVSASPTIPVDAEKPEVEHLIPNNSISTIENDLITDFSRYEVYFNEKVEGANFSFLRLFVMSSILFCCLYVGYFYRQKIKRYFFGNKNEVYYQPLRAMQRNAAD